MSLLKRLQSRLRRWAIPNLTTIIIAGQVLLYFAGQMRPGNGGGFDLSKILLLPGEVFRGEIWRLVTFVFYPPGRSPLFVIFFWYLFYLYGTSLERLWGTIRYNLYLLVAFLANIAAAFLVWALQGDQALLMAQSFIISHTGGLCGGNALLLGTVFLGFAQLFPDFVLNLFFVLPVRIKWLALIVWIGYGYVLVRGDWTVRIVVLAAILNYVLFFGRQHWRDLKHGHRRRSFQSQVNRATKAIAHKCLICGLDSNESPKTLFRYCSKCDGQCCYCPEHIGDHEHVVGDQLESQLADTGSE